MHAIVREFRYPDAPSSPAIGNRCRRQSKAQLWTHLFMLMSM
jgi:hypothetical protein